MISSEGEVARRLGGEGNRVAVLPSGKGREGKCIITDAGQALSHPQ